MRLRLPAFGLLLFALGTLPVPGAAQTVTELYVAPDSLRLDAGQRQGLTVQAFDDAGNAILAIRYRSSDSTVVRVADNGTVTALRAGRAGVTVTAGRKSRTIRVSVSGGAARPSPVAAVPVSEVAQLIAEPEAVALLPTEHVRIEVRGLKADGSPVGPVRVVWRTLQPEVAQVGDTSGIVTAASTGQGVIEGSLPGGPSVRVTVVVALSEFGFTRDRLVLAPDDSDGVTVTVPSQAGRRLHPEDLQWSVTDSTVATVSDEGVVHARAAGRSELVARGFLQERRVPLLVHQRVARFLVAPRLTAPVRLAARSAREFSLIPQTADSLPIEGVPITWTVGDTTVASFDPATGRLTALSPGSTTLAFAAPGFLPKSWTIEVVPGAIGLDRTRFGLSPGEVAPLIASFVDSSGTALAPAAGVAWSSNAPAVARVTADGAVQAVAPGRAVISAQAPGGIPASATVFVTGDLLVASNRGGRFGIYALAAEAPERFLPVVADSFSNSIDAVYSPDRTRLVFSSDRFGAGNFDIFVADADGRNPVRLTTDPAVDSHPAWTPDGRRIVFSSGRGGGTQLVVMNADGAEARPLTALPGGAEEPAVSPDGRLVAFTGYPVSRDEPGDIFLVVVDGGTPAPVTSTRDRRESRPFWLPGGELAWVLQRRDRKEPDQVMRQPAGGGPAVPLVTSELSLTDVALARDGSRLAWVASRPAEGNRSAAEFTLQWRLLASGAETSVRLLPGERLTSPAY